MGMSVFSTRLLTVFSGVLGVFWIYLLVKRSENKNNGIIDGSVAECVCWHLTYSRTVYEVNLGLTFVNQFVVFLFSK